EHIRVAIDDLRRADRCARVHQFVARTDDAHSWPAKDAHTRAPKTRQKPNLRRPERSTSSQNLLAVGHILTDLAHPLPLDMVPGTLNAHGFCPVIKLTI